MLKPLASLCLTVWLLTGCNIIVELKDPPEECGDNIVAGSEICDGVNLRGQTCEGLGFSGGTLACTQSCALDTNGCLPPTTCGNGSLQEPEQCDTDDLGEGTCESLGYYGGDLACDDRCRFDVADCSIHGRCGDDVLQSAEECDGADMGGATCESLGYYGGDVACHESCTFDLTSCEFQGRCGDNEVQAAHEACDGADMGGATCESLGYSGGQLACKDDCQYDAGGCNAPVTCGDSTIQSPEQCDGADLGDETCISRGFYGGTLLCSGNCTFDLSSCASAGQCGDSLLQNDYEACDGALLGEETCLTLGYYGGTLACKDDCQYDTTGCEPFGWCGDNILSEENGEVCDGTTLGEDTCEGLGYYGGQITCDASCALDLTDCENHGRCGDTTIQAQDLETCDGTNIGGATCEGLGYYGGTVTCDASCILDISDCIATGSCGDGLVQGVHGETCDGTELAGATCEGLGYYGGQITCDASCTRDLSGCVAVGTCGDAIIHGAFGETCDGTNLGGASCSSLGYYGGTLACDGACHLDLSQCLMAGQCGDGTVQTSFGETCDGSNLGGATCVSLGFYGGTLACSGCSFDTSDCETAGMCGDNMVQSAYGEDCDGTDPGVSSCGTAGYYGGTLACNGDCSYNYTDCAAYGYCGDGVLQSGDGEECDTSEFGGADCITLGFAGGGDLSCDGTCHFDTGACVM